MEIKILIALHLDRTEIIKEFIVEFHKSVHLSMKASKKVARFLFTSHIQKLSIIKYNNLEH